MTITTKADGQHQLELARRRTEALMSVVRSVEGGHFDVAGQVGLQLWATATGWPWTTLMVLAPG